MTESKSMKIIDDMINEERCWLKANLEELKDKVINILEEFDKLEGYDLYMKWKYLTHLHQVIASHSFSIMNLDLLQYRILEQEED